MTGSRQVHVAQELVPRLSDETPQPVALALGRVVRALGNAEKLDACIKAAEVVARYVAVAALASAAATRKSPDEPPNVENFTGNLSFGVFENAARASASVSWEHPLRGQLRLCLRSAKKRKAVAGQRLQDFVRLRNELGHAITHVDEARARVLLEVHDPIGSLLDLIGDLEAVLSYPLMVVLGQEHRKGRVTARVAFFAGEGEPIPQMLELRDAIFDWETPYLCTPEGLVPLEPGLIYAPRASDGRFGLFLLDAFDASSLRYKSVLDSYPLTTPEGVPDIAAWVRLPLAPEPLDSLSTRPPIEPIVCMDGRTLHEYLSGAAPPTEEEGHDTTPGGSAEGRKTQKGETEAISTLGEFERQANRSGLGAVYRDVVYFLTEQGGRATISGRSVRIATRHEPPRILATIELNAGPILSVVLLLGAITPGTNGTEQHDFRPGQSADDLVSRMGSLITPTDAVASGPPSVVDLEQGSETSP